MKEFLLVGNPNTGKTTFFNFLTKSTEKVGNWHGVTVEEKRKKIDDESELVDLPGIYSLTPLSFEEEVSVKYIYNHKGATILNICDMFNLKRNLYLTLELLEAGLNVILVINSMGKKCELNISSLEKKLGITCILFNGKNKKEIIEKIKNNKKNTKKIENSSKNNDILINYLKNNNIFLNFNNEFTINKINEKDDFFLNFNGLEKHKNNLYNLCENDSLEKVAKQRFNIIEDITKDMQTFSVQGKSKIDKIVLNKYLCIPIFLAIMFVIFYLTFFSVGAYISNILKYFIENIVGSFVSNIVRNLTHEMWVINLFEVAIVGGLGSLICFLPQIAMLFMFLHILETSGYLSRIAFVFEDLFSFLGLSGKSIYTLLMGFGCSTSAIMTARNMEDKNAKIKTAMITPYMSCSAKLPIYVVIGGAFFGKFNILIIFGLYLLGIVMAVLVSYILEKKILKTKQQSFILEFASYRLPTLKGILKVILENCKTFLIKVGSLLICMNIIVWILQNFDFTFTYVGSSGNSILKVIGEFLAPVFIPLGFGNYGAVSALIAGFIAKEIIVSSIAMLNGIDITKDFHTQTQNSILDASSVVFFSPISAISYMIFCLLYSPCISSLSMLKSEIGGKWTLVSVLIQLFSSYLLCLIVYQGLSLITKIGVGSIMIVIGIMIVIFSFYRVFKVLKNKKCKTCPHFSNCKNK